MHFVYDLECCIEQWLFEWTFDWMKVSEEGKHVEDIDDDKKCIDQFAAAYDGGSCDVTHI